MERRNGRHFNCARPYLYCPVWRCAVVLVEQYHQHWHGNFNRCGGACCYRHQLDKHQLENGLTAAGVIAVTALAFNLLLINEVAVPFSSLRSDKEIGLELAQSYRAVDEIGVYGKYSTSAVFYSGKKIIKLVPDEDLANFAPKAYSWKVKNVMPFEGINSFGRRGQLLLVKKNEAGKFLNGSNGKWLVTGEKGGWYILKSA